VRSCSSGFISEQGSSLCVKQSNTTIIYNNYCVDSCPKEAPYNEYTSIYYKCFDKCNNPK